MEDETTIVLLLLVVVFLFMRRSSGAGAFGTSAGTHGARVNTDLGPLPYAEPGEMYHGSDLGPFSPLTKLPGVGQAYQILRPINDKALQPAVKAINNSAPVRAINNALGGKAKTTVNPNGTITRTVPRNWYNDHIGSPVSHAGTTVVHKIGNAAKKLKFW